MHTSTWGFALLESFEGFASKQYDDGTGVMTIGFGTTIADVSPLPAFLSHAQGEQLLARKLREKYEPAVDAVHPPNQNVFDALVSFAYNCGPGAMAWDVGRDVRAGDLHAAADALLQYDRAGGRVMLGLTRRRQAERALMLKPAAPARSYLQVGDRGKLVYLLTHRLAVAGYLSHAGDFYSAHVAIAVKAFQTRHGMRPATGVCGARTFHAVKLIAEFDRAHHTVDRARPL